MQGANLPQQLTLQTAAGPVGLIAAPAHGSMMPLPAPTLLARVKQEDDKASQMLAPVSWEINFTFLNCLPIVIYHQLILNVALMRAHL